jgi:hypothetical protein
MGGVATRSARAGSRTENGGIDWAPIRDETSAGAKRCRRKFLRYYPEGFRDGSYLELERNYKWAAHEQWRKFLSPRAFLMLMEHRRYGEIAGHAVRIESRTNLLFSFEKMAIRDAVKSAAGAKAFAVGLFEYLRAPVGRADFERWRDAVASLPRRQTRVLTWPVLTVFPFIARPDLHIFLKPNVTRAAAAEYGFDFDYRSRPVWETYRSLRDFAKVVRRDVSDWNPRDLIDIQSFLWVQGSNEY